MESTLVYILLFPNPFEKCNEKFLSRELELEDAEERFFRIFKTSKSDNEKNNVVPQICFDKIQWLKDFSNSESKKETIYMSEFLISVISSVLYVLREQLNLKYKLLLSRDRDEIFVKIFANEQWFLSAAEFEDYKLQFKQTYTQEHLKQNKFKEHPPYGPIRLLKKKENEKLFKRYEEDGKEELDTNHESLFLYSDKARLVIQELGKILDLTSLKNYEIMISDFCVHQEKPLRDLQFNWANIEKIFQSQPLDKIRIYFSEKIALYFAWIGTYCQFMMISAVVGLLVQGSFIFIDENSDVRKFLVMGFAIFLTFWASTFDQFWVRKEKKLGWKWGTLNFEEVESQRAEFKGVYKRDEVTGKMKVIEKGGFSRVFRVIFSYSFILVLIFCVIAAVWSIFFLRQILFAELGQGFFIKIIPGLLNAIQIKIMNIIYGKLAFILNDWENHETENIYNDHLALKLFLFKFVNSYSSLLYIAFFSDSTMCKPNCLEHLSVQLAMIILTNLVMNGVELGLPWLKIKRKIQQEQKKIEKLKETDPTIRDFMYKVEEESKLEGYESPLDDYMEMVIQFGYVALFGASLPFVATLAFIEILLEIRVDAWKLSKLTRRPNPQRAADIGVWRSIILSVAYAGAFTNSGIIFFSMNLFEKPENNLLGFLLMEHAMIIGMYLINIIIPDLPDIVKDGKAWSERIANEKLLEGIINEKKKAEFSASKGTEPFWLKLRDIRY